MNKLIRLWNQNRKGFIAGIVIIIAILLLIQLLNYLYANPNKEKTKQEMEPINSAEQVKNVQIEKDTTDAITEGGTITKETEQQNVTTMKNFIKYCNEKNAEAAYNLLTNESRELLFPTLEDFNSKYIEKYFQTNRELDYELWITKGACYTYKITLLNNALAEGKLDNSNSYKDYFTILIQNGYWKLNIGGLIQSKSLNKETQNQGVKWEVTQKEVYKDYEIYNVKVTNTSGKAILLDTQKESKSIFLTGDNGTTYSAFAYEIPENNLIIQNNRVGNVKIKFNKIYNKINTKKITFSKVVPDYEFYAENGQTADFEQIEILVE